MIVLDASAAVTGLLAAGAARHLMAAEQMHAPHLIDIEVASALRRQVLAKGLESKAGWEALDVFRRLGMTRYPTGALLERVWELADNVSAYDALYVALAEKLQCELVTADARLSRAPGIRCAITFIPG